MERILNGRYRLGPRIGDGGMAVVYRGYDTLLGRSVAIKVLREQYAADPQFRARFEREAQAVAALTHPNIINIYDVGVDAGQHYFVMEFIDGPNLKEIIRARGPLPVDEVVAILVQVLGGLGYAHARGLVHRDVKPQNIMLTRDGTAKVTDFGIAKGLGDTTLTEAGIGMGTVHYLSPEQARGEPATPASDLYAAGVMLYEALTGALPFTGDSAVGVAFKHVHDAPPPPSQVNRAVPPPLSALTLQALEKDPGARFASAKEMANALRNWRAWPVGSARPRRANGDARAGAAAYAAGQTAVAPLPRRPARAAPSWNASGCITWLVGGVVLIGLLGLLLAGYRLTEGQEPTALANRPTATSTPRLVANTSPVVNGAAGSPTATEAGTATASSPPSPTRPRPSASPATPQPTATQTPEPTPSPTAILATIPNFGGMTLAQAQAAAQRAGLAVEQVGAENSNDVPQGQVIRQNPGAGQRVPQGRTVGLIISRGPLTVAIPNVRGKPYETAKAQLEGLGLVVAREDAASKTVAKGAVIDQAPEPGGAVSPGTSILLTVSSGDVVRVPNVVGLDYREAQRLLTEAGFNVTLNGQTREQLQRENPRFLQANPNLKDGEVISQSLPAGGVYDRGTTINIAYYKK